MSDPGLPAHDGAPDQDGAPQRTDLFRYLTSARSGEYRQIMDLFTGPLLGDLSPADVAARLADSGIEMATDDVAARCEKLERRGNLIRGVAPWRFGALDYDVAVNAAAGKRRAGAQRPSRVDALGRRTENRDGHPRCLGARGSAARGTAV